MLGQHPQMYGLPETHLFSCETLAERWARCVEATYPMSDGLLRAVAELFFGEQTVESVERAAGWLRRRHDLTTGGLFELLARRAHPLILVDKSPSLIYQVEWMRRAYSMFPDARFLHLLRHPRGFCESIPKYIRERLRHGSIPPSHWLLVLCSYRPPAGIAWEPPPPPARDAQWAWYTLNRNVADFLGEIPPSQWLRIHGEDVLSEPEEALGRIARWLEIRDDPDALEAMKRPELSPYACFGPPNARYGNDVFFIRSPALRPGRASVGSLDGPLSWRADGHGFAPEVRRLAEEFGYR
jgi:hypothetical protein